MSAVDDTARAAVKELEARIAALEKSRFTSTEEETLEVIAMLVVQRKAAIDALELICDTDTHAGKVCGTCHSRIGRASQLIGIAREALKAIEYANKPSGRLPGDAADVNNAVGTGSEGVSSGAPSGQPPEDNRDECRAAGCGCLAGDDGYCNDHVPF